MYTLMVAEMYIKCSIKMGGSEKKKKNQTCGTSISAYQMLGLQECVTMPRSNHESMT